jgi:predicted molibdopterin-dependent oxidoreductase YjgC
MNEDFLASEWVSCGVCVQACPTVPGEIAAALAHLYRDAAEHPRIAEAGMEYVRENYGEAEIDRLLGVAQKQVLQRWSAITGDVVTAPVAASLGARPA